MSQLQVKKANFLVPLEEAVSKPAQLLASYIVASLPKLRVESEELPQLHLPYAELRCAINADGKERVNKVQDIMRLGVELQRCVLFYEDNVSERTVTWLIEQERNKQSNIFTYTLHPSLKKYLINLEKHFTKYNYLFRVCLNAHAMKLYEMLKMYQFRGDIIMNIEDDLKPSLGLTGKYPKVYDFKRRVLHIAQDEIAKYTDIRFEYEVAEKKGKTPISFRFIIHANQPTDLPPELLDKFKAEGGLLPKKVEESTPIVVEAKVLTFPDIYTRLKEWGGSEEHISNLLETHGESAMRYQITHLQRNLKGGKKIGNPFAWLATALKGNFRDAVQDKKTAQTVQIKKRKEQQSKKEMVAINIKVLEQEYHEKIRQECDVLLSKKAGLLATIIKEMEEHKVIRKALLKGKTPQKIYEERWTSWTVQTYIQERFPAAFQAIKAQFLPKIKALKKP